MNEIITDYLDAKQLADRLTELELRSTSELARLERERDEAREKINRQANRIRYLEGATNHACGTPLSVALRERDEARKHLEEETKFHHRTHIELIQTQCKLLDMEMQRDEAREKLSAAWQSLRDSQDEVLRLTFENRELSQSIEGWENKWKCAVDMAARAELERDEARELAQQMSESNQVLQAEVRDYRKKEKANPFYKY
jgi:hypothetical protein